MKRLINIALLLSFLICYLEWGTSNHSFIFEMEYYVFTQSDKASSFSHPLILIPFAGQLLILYSVYKPSKRVTTIGIILLSILVLFILLAGLLSINFKIIISTIPFIFFSILFFYTNRKSKKAVSRT